MVFGNRLLIVLCLSCRYPSTITTTPTIIITTKSRYKVVIKVNHFLDISTIAHFVTYNLTTATFKLQY